LDDDEEEDESKLCPCCNFPYESNRFSLCASILQLGELGCGFSLYYDLIKALVLMMVAAIAWSVYALYDNYTADNESEWHEQLDGHFIISGTI
jgi:hypothetical protein